MTVDRKPVAADRVSVIDVDGAPPAYRRYYSNAVRVAAGDMLYVSGQVAWDDKGDVVCVGDGPGQARQAFANIGRILAAHDATYADIVRITVYVTDMSWFDELSAIRERIFTGVGPASTILQVAGLVEPELLIEIDVVAVVA
jgi:enamine deaminase RidA (YjgF/YER057c/UK114 family)